MRRNPEAGSLRHVRPLFRHLQEKIEAQLDSLCDVVPVQKVRAECVGKINGWVEQVIDEYNKHTVQEDVCKTLLLCN
jgi:hypothetical protein